jgi:hypothetical protein
MIKLLHILLFSLGLFFIPNEINGCSAKKETKNCESVSDCKKLDSKISNFKNSKENNCSEKLTDSKTKSKNSHHDCNGHCNHNSCNCASYSFMFNLPQTIDLKIGAINLDSKNNIIFHDENQLSSGFHSIWLPPVIS